MWNEIFSRREVAGKTEIGIVTNPKLIEPFQIALIQGTDLRSSKMRANCE